VVTNQCEAAVVVLIIIKMIKSIMSWAGQAARIRENRSTSKDLVKKNLKERDNFKTYTYI
jgi:hypothetical protein